MEIIPSVWFLCEYYVKQIFRSEELAVGAPRPSPLGRVAELARSGEVPCRFAQLHRQELEPLPSRLRRATFPKGEGIASLNSSLSSDFSRGDRGEPCDFGDVRVPSPGRG